jgi:hypothetical protein
MENKKRHQIKERVRRKFIKDNILSYMAPENINTTKDRIEEIISAYTGQDRNALSILSYAAEKGRFDEFAERLENYSRLTRSFIHPELRGNQSLNQNPKAEEFFLDCYLALGIKPED